MEKMFAAEKVVALLSYKCGCNMGKMFAAGKVVTLLTVILQFHPRARLWASAALPLDKKVVALLSYKCGCNMGKMFAAGKVVTLLTVILQFHRRARLWASAAIAPGQNMHVMCDGLWPRKRNFLN